MNYKYKDYNLFIWIITAAAWPAWIEKTPHNLYFYHRLGTLIRTGMTSSTPQLYRPTLRSEHLLQKGSAITTSCKAKHHSPQEITQRSLRQQPRNCMSGQIPPLVSLPWRWEAIPLWVRQPLGSWVWDTTHLTGDSTQGTRIDKLNRPRIGSYSKINPFQFWTILLWHTPTWGSLWKNPNSESMDTTYPRPCMTLSRCLSL